MLFDLVILTKSITNFVPTFVYLYLLPERDFNEHCLMNIIYILKKIINLYISYTLSPLLRN